VSIVDVSNQSIDSMREIKLLLSAVFRLFEWIQCDYKAYLLMEHVSMDYIDVEFPVKWK
jgi:hypothetical protein